MNTTDNAVSSTQKVSLAGQDLRALFHPGSIALVGVPRGLKPGKVFLMGLLDLGFKGPIYPVHPDADEIDGLKAYPSLIAIPDTVDLVIVMSPKETVWGVLKECERKKVKIVIVYTSGFSEIDTVKGRQDEARMNEIAHRGGFRIVGPNCMGIYSPSSGLAPFPFMPKLSGSIAFLTQSGSLMNLFINMCSVKKLFFSHGASYGNSCDVDFPELLEWVMADENAKIVCSYCEGIKDMRKFIGVLHKTAGFKPIIMWKVGQTDAGKKAAASHTGTLAGEHHIWEALFRQFGIISVADIEEMLDVTMALYHLPLRGEGRVAIISGPGGPAVSAADAVEMNGLTLARLGDATIKRLEELLPETGTSKTNPVDVGLGASFDLRYYLDSLEVLSQDPNVDAIIILGGGVTDDLNEQYVKGIIRIKEDSDTHIISIAYPGFIQDEKVLQPFYDNGIPVYSTPERALRAYAALMRFYRFQKSLGRDAG
ncbi:MAG TPA: CoA-binding protein [Deltaproteobacteria bacterium]|nr:CoA-binding protein [Deltaproteobacteria bacterium]